MKKDDLIALGITEEQAEKVLAINSAELTAEKEKAGETAKKLAAAEANVKEITDKLKAYDGVDVEKLKSAAAEWEAKYNADMQSARLENAVELELTKLKARDVALAKNLIDRKLLKEEDGKVVGLKEQLEKIRNEKAWLFEDSEKPAEEKKDEPVPRVNVGGSDHNKLSGAAPLTLRGAVSEAYAK